MKMFFYPWSFDTHKKRKKKWDNSHQVENMYKNAQHIHLLPGLFHSYYKSTNLLLYVSSFFFLIRKGKSSSSSSSSSIDYKFDRVSSSWAIRMHMHILRFAVKRKFCEPKIHELYTYIFFNIKFYLHFYSATHPNTY